MRARRRLGLALEKEGRRGELQGVARVALRPGGARPPRGLVRLSSLHSRTAEIDSQISGEIRLDALFNLTATADLEQLRFLVVG